MTRHREYREYDYDDRTPDRERPPSNRRPPRQYEESPEYDDRFRGRPPVRETQRKRYDRPPRSADGWHQEARRPPNRNGPPPYYRKEPPDRDYGGRGRESSPPRQRPPRPTHQGTSTLQEAKKSTNRKIFLFVYNLIFYSFTIGILLTSVMFAFSDQTDASIMGYRFYQVLTDSMAPQEDSPGGGFYSGDIVIVKMMDGAEVQPGDIVTYQLGGEKNYLTHRMVERLTELNGEPGDYIVTKGDANNSNDPPIKADRVHGKVIFVVPKVGALLAFIRNSFWLCLVCALSLFGFFLVLKAYFLEPKEKDIPVRKGYR